MDIILKLEPLLLNLEKDRRGRSVGLITGCFDILHQGHRDLLSFAKSKCDILIVGVDTDSAVKKTKGNDRPINSQKIRAYNLSRTNLIDYILILSNKDSFNTEDAAIYYDELCIRIRPNYLFTTTERDTYLEAKKKRAIECGADLITFRMKNNISTTRIIELSLDKKNLT